MIQPSCGTEEHGQRVEMAHDSPGHGVIFGDKNGQSPGRCLGQSGRRGRGHLGVVGARAWHLNGGRDRSRGDGGGGPVAHQRLAMPAAGGNGGGRKPCLDALLQRCSEGLPRIPARIRWRLFSDKLQWHTHTSYTSWRG